MFSEPQCWDYFRFRKADMPTLLHELQFPITPGGMVRVHNNPGRGQRLVSFSYSCRYSDRNRLA